jgi:hypothetical protein
MSLVERLRDKAMGRLQTLSVLKVVRLSCWIALVGLAVMAASIIFPGPLMIIFATSVGQVIGMAAVLCYGLAVVGDVVRGRHHPPDAAGPAGRFSAPASDADGPSDA